MRFLVLCAFRCRKLTKLWKNMRQKYFLFLVVSTLVIFYLFSTLRYSGVDSISKKRISAPNEDGRSQTDGGRQKGIRFLKGIHKIDLLVDEINDYNPTKQFPKKIESQIQTPSRYSTTTPHLRYQVDETRKHKPRGLNQNVVKDTVVDHKNIKVKINDTVRDRLTKNKNKFDIVSSDNLKFRHIENKRVFKNKLNSTGADDSSKQKHVIPSSDKNSKISKHIKGKQNHVISKLANQHRERFMIYLCNATSQNCHGLGDRQKAIASVFALSMATNRTFGLIWTQPSDVNEFFRPNKVNWNIPPGKLIGRSSKIVQFLKYPISIDFGKSLDAQFPEDVVYISTNMYFLDKIVHRWRLRKNIPKKLWTFGGIWLHLMTPTPLIRQPLNDMLTKIAKDIKTDAKIQEILNTSICENTCSYLSNENYQNQTTISPDVINCFTKVKSIFTNYSSKIPDNDLPKSISKLCPKANESGLSINDSLLQTDIIQRSKGFDVIDLGLVCAHVRIGRSREMPSEPPRNALNSTKVLWDFLLPYVEQGRHVYLATDYHKVREQARQLFGNRVHSSDLPITHIDKESDRKRIRLGTILALWENLLLMTSCRTFVMSYSGYSLWAASVRDQLIGGEQKFIFRDGEVKRRWF